MKLESLKSWILEELKEFAKSRNRGPFSKRVFQCSECNKMIISHSRPDKNGCPAKGEHNWVEAHVQY